MIFLGIGSNLSSNFGNRYETINLCVDLLNAYNLKVLKRSSFYETPSYPDKTKPKFINVVVSIRDYSHKKNIRNLVNIITYIEKKLGRKRNKKNYPRTCDIDIIDYNKKLIKLKNNYNIEIPHKRLVFRNFVLYPLSEICPKWRHPLTKISIIKLINKLPSKDKKSILKINNY